MIYNQIDNNPNFVRTKKVEKCAAKIEDENQIELEVTGDIGKVVDKFKLSKMYKKEPFEVKALENDDDSSELESTSDCSSDISSVSDSEFSDESES